MSEPNRIVVDEYHGTSVSDPYRWLEEDGPDVWDWIGGQQARCEAYFAEAHVARYLQEIEPLVRQQLTRDAIVGQILVRQNSYFYMRRRKSDQQASIVVRHGLNGQEEVLVDPLLRDAEGFTSVELLDVSAGCKWLAYGVRMGGSHQQAVEILDLETRSRHSWSLPSGFLRSFIFEQDFTARYIHEDPSAERPHLRRELRQRLLGEDHYQKVHYVAGESKHLRFLTYYSDDLMLGIYRMIRLGSPKRETLMLLNRWDCGAPMVLIADDSQDSIQFQIFSKSVYVCTDCNAPNKRICRLNLECPTLDDAETVIPETSEKIQWWKVVGERIFVTYVRDLVNVTEIFDLEGARKGSVQYPGDGSAELVGRDDASGEIFVMYESYATPPSVLRVSMLGDAVPFGEKISSDTAAAEISLNRCEAVTPDNVGIPYTVLGLPHVLNQTDVPAILTGYGGFGTALTPRFSAFAQIWIELGGAFVVANLRGGSEFGATWQNAAKGRDRKVAFQDFRSVAEDLFARCITSPRHFGIAGGSNAGLMVTHAMTEWPDQIRAVLCVAPITDLLRFNLQKPEYAIDLGSIENADDFEYLLQCSPFHRVLEPRSLPALLMVSGAKDDICAPYHALKFVAAAQASSTSRAPILLDFDRMRGHSPNLPLEVRISALARRLAFMGSELSEMKGGEKQ